MTYTEELIQKRVKIAYEEGYRQGFQEGLEEGRREGIRLAKLSIAFHLIKKDLSVEKIAALLDMEPAEILQHQEESELSV